MSKVQLETPKRTRSPCCSSLCSSELPSSVALGLYINTSQHNQPQGGLATPQRMVAQRELCSRPLLCITANSVSLLIPLLQVTPLGLYISTSAAGYL